MKPTIRAKFTLSFVQQHVGWELWQFEACYTGSAEDNSYASATPSANLAMTIGNPALIGTVKAGAKFYLDFTPADETPKAE